MKTIIVPTDFSITARNAANYAADMAIVLQAKLILFHTYQIPVSHLEIPFEYNSGDLQKNAEAEIEQLKMHVSEHVNGNLQIDTEVRFGDFFTELNEYCELIKPYCVVIGSQGQTAAERIFLGGNTMTVVKKLNFPVITVPIVADYKNIKSIGLACDFDKVIDNVHIEEIKLLVHDFKAKLHILNVGKEREFNAEVINESGSLQEMLANMDVKYHFITHSDIDEGIIHFAESNDIDLLIVLPKRHSLLEKLLSSSHTKKLVLHSKIPVMVLHQKN